MDHKESLFSPIKNYSFESYYMLLMLITLIWFNFLFPWSMIKVFHQAKISSFEYYNVLLTLIT